MNKRFLPVVAFALLVSGAATFFVYKMLAAKLTANAAPAQAQVVVATHDLQVGSLITSADVRLADWSGPVPKGVATAVDGIVNRGVVMPVFEGEPVLETRLAAKGAGAGMAATIPMGMRAVALRVNEIVGVAGFVVPGMRVDVIISGTPPNAGHNLGTLTKTVLQNIAVLSAGQKIEKSAEGKPESVGVVNVLVTPEQAEILSLASNQTQIQLVLRNPLDREETKTPGTATAHLFKDMKFRNAAGANTGAPRPAAPRPVQAVVPVPAPAPAKVVIPFVVEVFHGGKKVQAEFRTSAEEKN